MSKDYSIETKDGITTIRMFAQVSLAGIRMVFDEMANNNPSNLRLWHLQKGWNLTSDEIREFAEHTKTRANSDIRIAVVTNEDLSFGLTRMFHAYRDDENLQQRNFATEEEGIDWLLNA